MIWNGNVRFTPRATVPSNPVEGMIYYDSVTKYLKVFADGFWKKIEV